MAVDIVITNQGRAALVNAQNTGTAPVTIAQVGITATAFVATLTATALPGEIKRIPTISGEVVADDTIHVNITDASADVYNLRGFALYLADGTLFAIYGQDTPLLSKSAESIGAVAIDVVFADILAATLTFGDANFTNPPATTERSGVVELATVAEAQAGIDALRALTPAGARAAVLGWLLAQDGAGSGLDADLLDGQQGAWYADIPGRLGFTPLNAASYNAGDVRAKLLTVDGAGSALDADLLDGQHGAWYADIIGRLGFTPANKAGDTFTGTVFVNGDIHARRPGTNTGVIYLNDAATRWLYFNGFEYILQGAPLRVNGGLAWSEVNDGSGSGLDADLLDGQQGAWYADIAARLGFTPANKAGDTFTGPVYVNGDVHARRPGTNTGEIFLNEAANRSLRFNGFDYVLQGTDLYVNGGRAWTGANDGAGSGLDADLLDGLNSSAFAQIADFTGANQSLTTNGFQKLPGGLIMQWGEVYITQGEGIVSVNWPMAFPNACFPPVGIIRGAPSNADMWLQLDSYSLFGATFRYQSTGGNQGYGLAFEVKGY